MQTEHVSWLIGALIIGACIGLVLRSSMRPGQATARTLEWTDFGVIYVLLPIHVGFSTIIVQSKIEPLLLAASFGLLLPVLTRWVATRMGTGTRLVHLPLAAASFGGGNRGIFLLSMLSMVAVTELGSFLRPAFEQGGGKLSIFDYFAVMDFVYFAVFQIWVAPSSDARELKGLSAIQQSNVLVKPGIALMVVLAVTLFLPNFASEKTVELLRSNLSLLLGAVATTLVVARVKWKISAHLVGVIFQMLLSRFVVLAGFAALVTIGLLTQMVGGSEWWKLVTVFSVFLFVPPSSYISSFISAHGDSEEVDEINSISAMWTFLLYFLMAIAVLFVNFPPAFK